jgi:hypothetical protein
MEWLISSLLYKGDFSRVVYSKEDMCFRRRLETLGSGDVASSNVSYVSLHLPFSCYSQTGNYEPDDRPGSMNAGAAIRGQMQESGILVKYMPVKIDYTIVSFFSRRDDVNIASQLLYWEANPKAPLYYVVHHSLCGYPLDIPVYMSLDQTDMNVDYNEKKWLEESRIFPLKTKVTIRTYQTLIESIDKTTWFPLRFQGLYGYNGDNKIILTQSAVLLWADEKFSKKQLSDAESQNPELIDADGPMSDVTRDELYDHGRLNVEFNDGSEYRELLEEEAAAKERAEVLQSELLDESKTSAELAALQAENEALQEKIQYLEDAIVLEAATTVAEAVTGYFDPDTSLKLVDYCVNEELTTETELVLEWRVDEASLKYFDHVQVYLPGFIRKRVTDHEGLVRFTITDLDPGSEYEVTLIAHSVEGGDITYVLKGQTKGEVLYTPTKLSDQLVGRVFTNRK